MRQAVYWAGSFELALFRTGVIAFTYYLTLGYHFGESVLLNSLLASKLDIEKSPNDWAMTQGNLGNAFSQYTQLPKGDTEANLRQAITFYSATLNV